MPTKPVKPVNASDRSEAAKKNKSEDDDGSAPRWKGVGKSDGRRIIGRRRDKEKRASKESNVHPELIPFASRSAIKVREGCECDGLGWARGFGVSHCSFIKSKSDA